MAETTRDTGFYARRDQYIFINYNEIIKMTYPVMLKELVDKYYDDLNDYLYLDMIKNYDIYNLERLCLERIVKNPLIYLKRENCPKEICDKLLKTFEREMVDMYAHSKFTKFGGNLYNVLMQPFVKEVYIYSEEPYEQIPYDCMVYFKEFNNKLKFVSGDFIELIKQLPTKPTTYILNDVDYVQQLIDNDLIGYTEILIGELGYNFVLDEDTDGLKLKHDLEDKMEKYIFKLGYVPLIDLEDKHFSCLKELTPNDK